LEEKEVREKEKIWGGREKVISERLVEEIEGEKRKIAKNG